MGKSIARFLEQLVLQCFYKTKRYEPQMLATQEYVYIPAQKENGKLKP